MDEGELVNLDEILICRCEGVSLAKVLQSIEDGATSVQGIKKRCRVGMGYCQGRTCQPIVRDVLIEKVGANTVTQIQTAQPPVRPIHLGKL